jgi:hypothetical protein
MISLNDGWRVLRPPSRTAHHGGTAHAPDRRDGIRGTAATTEIATTGVARQAIGALDREDHQEDDDQHDRARTERRHEGSER